MSKTPPSGSPPGSDAGAASAAGPTPQQALEFLQRMWNPLGAPIPGFAMPGVAPGGGSGAAGFAGAFPFVNPAAMFTALDPAAIEQKLGELRVVEGWLAMSLNLMQMSIRTMELQKASLEALRGTPKDTSPS